MNFRKPRVLFILFRLRNFFSCSAYFFLPSFFLFFTFLCLSFCFLFYFPFFEEEKMEQVLVLLRLRISLFFFSSFISNLSSLLLTLHSVSLLAYFLFFFLPLPLQFNFAEEK